MGLVDIECIKVAPPPLKAGIWKKAYARTLHGWCAEWRTINI